MTIQNKELPGNQQRSKRKPTSKQTMEQTIQRIYTEILATQQILHHHLKQHHNFTDLEISNFYRSVLTPQSQPTTNVTPRTEPLKIEENTNSASTTETDSKQ